ncbi:MULTISPECIES: response regulator transcription factor [Bradyrhizobium]|uniref:Regulatory protein VirG n=1 Tax=Bradyrhizobium elkanii TaxID=29448 RepID=A0A4U6RHW3_BRAEL|nr:MULTISPECIES: response regulator transcription factor [Bradyrhizobium]MTV12342.1 response regulator transcription factor [Bradyrhizobium sp. BR2003]TKV73540.1 response regulator transcription factor [Bradyrhizobium elkanii]
MQILEYDLVAFPVTNARILCVEDDADIARMLAEVLQDNGFRPVLVGSAVEMDTLLKRESFDLIVLDVMLPGEDGLSICRRLRMSSTIPIIMLTARGEDIDRILGLELGADDYVTKPFNSREVVARIRALLRRVESGSVSPSRPRPLTFAGWRINPTTRELHDPAGVRITLTGAEFDLLLTFCRNPGRVLSREQLIEQAFGGLIASVERSVDVHISRIRQKIEPDPKDRSMIKTVRLGGYLFTPAVEQI